MNTREQSHGATNCRVVTTGYGCVTPLGNTVAQLWDSIVTLSGEYEPDIRRLRYAHANLKSLSVTACIA